MRPIPPRLVVLSVFLCVVPSGAPAQQLASAGEVAADVDALFAEYGPQTPGCALGVMHDGALLYARGYGMADLDHGLPIGPQSVFRIASVSKQFTAAVAALAAQNGVLSLDDDIRTWLPEMPDYGTPITIRMLLHHTSGIRDYLTLADLAGLRDDDWYTDEEALALIVRQRNTNFAPGSEHLYSNSGYFLVSQIILRATGQSLREYAAETLFGPLGMEHTHFHDDHKEIVPGRAAGYAPEDDGYRISMTTLDMIGDGGVFTTVEDLLAWDRNFDEPTVGGPELIAALLTRGVLSNGDTLDYALGLEHGERRGLETVSHDGSFVGYRADMVRFPGQRLSVATLCNVASADPGTLSLQVADLFLAGFGVPSGESAGDEGGPDTAGADEVVRAAITPEQAARYAGRYHAPELGVDYEIEADGAVLSVKRGRGAPIPLEPTVEGEFMLRGDRMTFDPGPEGAVPTGFAIDAGRVRGIRFERVTDGC